MRMDVDSVGFIHFTSKFMNLCAQNLFFESLRTGVEETRYCPPSLTAWKTNTPQKKVSKALEAGLVPGSS